MVQGEPWGYCPFAIGFLNFFNVWFTQAGPPPTQLDAKPPSELLVLEENSNTSSGKIVLESQNNTLDTELDQPSILDQELTNHMEPERLVQPIAKELTAGFGPVDRTGKEIGQHFPVNERKSVKRTISEENVGEANARLKKAIVKEVRKPGKGKHRKIYFFKIKKGTFLLSLVDMRGLKIFIIIIVTSLVQVNHSSTSVIVRCKAFTVYDFAFEKEPARFEM